MKKQILVCLIILLLATVNVFYWGSKKQGMFLDEIYTYALANFQNNVDPSVDIVTNQRLSSEAIRNYLEVGGDENIDFQSVYHNVESDKHPPLYFCLIHLVSYFFPDSHSQWIGIGINLVSFLFLLALFFQLVNKIFGSLFVSSVTTLLFAISRVGVSSVIQIRMYALLTLFAVFFVAQIWDIYHDGKPLRAYVGVLVSIWLGIMTQYIFVIFASLVCAAFSIYLFHMKKSRESVYLLISLFLGIVLSILSFPDIVSDLLVFHPDVSGASAIERLMDISDWGRRLFYYSGWVGLSMIWICLFSFVLLIMVFVNRKMITLRTESCHFLFVLLIPTLIAYFIVCLVSPWIAPRYIYYLIPFFLLLLPFLLQTVVGFVKDKGNKCLQIGAVICAILTVAHSFFYRPEWLYEDDDINKSILAEHKDAKCIYFFNHFYAPISSALHLLETNDFFLAGNMLSNDAVDYAESSSGDMILFIESEEDENSESYLDPEEIIDEIIDKTSFTVVSHLFDSDFSQAFILTK